MTQPLALVFYERLMPGSQLVNRLQDLHYRVVTLNNPAQLVATARREMPLLVIVDLESPGDIVGQIAKIKTDTDITHLPVIAFAPDTAAAKLEAARQAGAGVTVTESALGNHLQQLLEQALHID